MLNNLKLHSKRSIQHYLYIANEYPALEPPHGFILLKNSDLNAIALSLMPTNALCLISAARERGDAINRNVYELTLQHDGNTIRELLQQMPSLPRTNKPLVKPHYHIDPKPVNGIKLEDLSAQLNVCEGQAPLGIFLVRQAKLDDISRYVKKACVDRLETITPATWFLVNESIPFEATTALPDHLTVHEVAYVQDYGMVYWLRSRGPAKSSVGKHFTISCWNEYDSVPPAPGWLNVLVSNETDGSTTYLQRIAESVKLKDPFQLIVLVQAVDVMNVLQQPDETVLGKLCSLFGVQSEPERTMVATVQLVLLIDHAIADNGSDVMAKTLVQFLNSIDDSTRQRMTVWIVGDDLLWTCVTTNCKHSAIKHAIPKLEEEQWKECLAQMLDKDGTNSVESIAERIIASNSRSVGNDIFGNLFVLSALAETVQEEGASPLSSCWWIDAMERYVWKHIAPPESKELDELERYCFERVFDDSADPTRHFSSRSRIQHRTLQTLLATKYLTKHPHLIDIAKYRRFGYTLIDLLLFRHNPIAIAVLHHDLDTVRRSTLAELASIADCLQRNLLHVVHNSKEIGDILLSAGIPFDQPCAAQLMNWTPIQMAMERNDWPLVDCLLAKGAKLSRPDTKLHTMPESKLSQVVCDCIAGNCPSVVEWILENRSDYQITQENIYSLSAFEEFGDRDLVFRLLTLAQEQGLPAREPPYRYIFDNTALDNAVADYRVEMAIFLVERLHFEPTDDFEELRARYQENPKLEEYKRMFEFCKEGELDKVQRMIEEDGLDPHTEHDGSNLLIQAAASGNVELVQYLFETCGFEDRVDDCDEQECTALSQALAADHQPIVQFLLDHKATPNSAEIKHYPNRLPDDSIEVDTEDFLSLIACNREKLQRLAIDYNRYESGELLLHCYISYVDEPDEDTFRFLLSQYDNVDVRTDVSPELRCGETPLHIALKRGNKRCRDILLAAGADIQAKSLKHGLTSLHYAIMGGTDRPFIKRLIEEYGFDVNVRDERGRTISFYMPPNIDLYQWLIDQYQFDPCARDNNGQSLLHHKVIKNSFFARAEIEYLLKMPQFSLSHTDNRGRLPLHYAVDMNNLTIVQLLLKYRPDVCHVPDGE
uniref:ANK_REP_REGION domain-containing protein n=1 Tax=Anopheles maculatus TaxID=74869 RepID=A0A182SWR2_9DIPT